MTAPARFDLVIFDLDGTLVDSAPDIAAALNHTLEGIGVPALSLDVVTGYVGDGAAKLLERALAGVPAPEPRPPSSHLLQTFLERYRDHLCEATRLYPGIVDLLASLRAQGTALAVLTNKPDALVRPLLERLSVADQFVAIVGDGAGYPRKPDPTAARSLLTRAGTTPARSVVVGDGVPDIRMARAVPCASVAALWGYVSEARLIAEGPTHAAASAAEVARILCHPEAAGGGPASEG